MPKLIDPIAYGARQAKNRIVMAPMLTTMSEIDGFPTPWHEKFYRSRAADGPGLVIVECTAIDKSGRNSPGELGLYKDEHIGAMRTIARAIREGGALALVQIHHAGRATPSSVNESPLAPSGETLPDGRIVREMDDKQVLACIENFALAAARAHAAGFDGVELHGCHGYLIDQFISPTANRRRDRWNGDALEQRLAFSRAVIEAVRARTPEDFVLGYRMGFNDPDSSFGPAIGESLAALGVDYLHVSGGIGPGPMPEAVEGAHGFWLAARQVKERVGIPVIAVNTIHTLDLAEKVVAEGFADAAAVARPYLLNPRWQGVQREGGKLVKCLQCKGGCRYLRGNCPYLPLPQ